MFFVFVLGFVAGVLSLTVWLSATNQWGSRAHASEPALVEHAQPPVVIPAPAPKTATELPPPPALSPPPASTPITIPQASITPRADPSLTSRNLGLPIANLKRSDIQDTFNETRGTDRRHEATDILAPKGTPVLAIDEGNVVKLFSSYRGGLTVYQFDNPQIYCYYYAHLDHYAPGLKEGMLLRKGDVLGYVGTTGNADANTPHLHLAIFQLGPDKRWWKGTPIDPYPLLLSAFQRQAR
jgi:murein DD-endopeptidase MepM/ murein hydrolase activator NlpD